MNVKRFGIAMATALLTMGLAAGALPAATAGGTIPTFSGSYTLAKFETYFGGVAHNGVVAVQKLNENNPNYDYYTTVNTIEQTKDRYWYDNLQFWTAMGAHNTYHPWETDYDPGVYFVDNVRGFSVSNNCNAPCSSTYMAAGWFNQWCGQWTIHDQRTYDPEPNNGWSLRAHNEHFYVKSDQCEDSASRGRTYDWDLETFATSWTVPSKAPAIVGVHSYLRYCSDFWECADGPHKIDRSPVTYYVFSTKSNLLCLEEQETQDAKSRTTYGDQTRESSSAESAAREGVKMGCGLEDPVLPPPNVGELVPAVNPAEDPECGWEPLFPDCDPSTPTDPEYWANEWLSQQG